jgi:serine/threonine protein kinase
MLVVGGVLDDRYELRGLLGSGGMAVVWCAWDRAFGRKVAIKVLDASQSKSASALKRFRQEAAIAIKLDHANVCKTYGFGVTAAGQPYLVCEFVEGESLADRISSQPIDEKLALQIFAQLNEALDYLHQRGILHRDIKPSNVMLTACETGTCARVIDFGIAKDTAEQSDTSTGALLGSLPYIAPEVLQGAKATTASDVFALGCLMYEALSGQSPWGEDDVLTKKRMLPLPVSVSEKLRHVISAMLEDEQTRPKNISDVTSLLNGKVVRDTKVKSTRSLWRARTKAIPILSAAAAIVITGVVFSFATYSSKASREQIEESNKKFEEQFAKTRIMIQDEDPVKSRDAASELLAVLDTMPEVSQEQRLLGQLSVAKSLLNKQPKEAKAEYLKAIDIFDKYRGNLPADKYVFFHNMLGEFYNYQKQYDLSLSHYFAAIEKFRNNRSLINSNEEARSLYLCANSLLQKTNFSDNESAIDDCNHFLRLTPNSLSLEIQTRWLLAKRLKTSGQFNKAAHEYKVVLEKIKCRGDRIIESWWLPTIAEINVAAAQEVYSSPKDIDDLHRAYKDAAVMLTSSADRQGIPTTYITDLIKPMGGAQPVVYPEPVRKKLEAMAQAKLQENPVLADYAIVDLALAQPLIASPGKQEGSTISLKNLIGRIDEKTLGLVKATAIHTLLNSAYKFGPTAERLRYAKKACQLSEQSVPVIPIAIVTSHRIYGDELFQAQQNDAAVDTYLKCIEQAQQMAMKSPGEGRSYALLHMFHSLDRIITIAGSEKAYAARMNLAASLCKTCKQFVPDKDLPRSENRTFTLLLERISGSGL